MSDIRSRIVERMSGPNGRSTSWSFVGQFAALLASTANLVVLARIVGPVDYGLVAGALGVVYTIGPFSALGADKLVVRDITARRTSRAAAVTAALATVVGGAAVSCALMAGLHDLLLPQVPLVLLLALAVAELGGSSTVLVCVRTFFAIGAVRAAGITHSVISAVKLVAVFAFVASGSSDPSRWALLYAGFSAVAAAGCVLYVFSRLGAPALQEYSFMRRAREGLPFSLNVSAVVAQNDFDKVILVRSGFTEQAGAYTVAYRVVNMVMLPVTAVMSGVYTRYFELGAEGGITATRKFARRLAVPLTSYAVLVGVLLVLVAPMIPLVLGPGYDATVPLLMALAALPLLKVVQQLPSEALTGAGHQPVRTVCAGLSAALNVGLCFLLIPGLGVTGALVATYASEVVGAVLVLVAVTITSRRTASAAS